MASLDAAALPTDMDVHRTRAFLRRAAANGAAMMLSDESDEVRARRRDAIIAAARSNGVAVFVARSEPASVYSRFSTLMQLLAPLQSEFGRLRPVHRAALTQLTEQRQPGDADAVTAAVAELFGLVSAGGPALVVVDNIEWIDTGSAEVLAVIARNVAALRLGLLACLRRSPGSAPELQMPAVLNQAPWVAAPDRSTRAARAPGRRRDLAGRGSLTRQEHEVALLAASGLTNRCIAERLFVSHRTISAHLRQVFPKLGVATRASLRDSLAEQPLASDSPAPPADLAGIKPRELQIAMLAATGLTNKQIADRLYLSHRTVGANLYRIFPKLGITTRAALRDALASLPVVDAGQDNERRCPSVMSG